MSKPVVVHKPYPRREPQMSGVNCPNCGNFMEHARSSLERFGCATTDPTLIYHPTWTDHWERPGAKCYGCGEPFPESWAVDRGEYVHTPSGFDAMMSSRANAIIKAERAGKPAPTFPPVRLYP